MKKPLPDSLFMSLINENKGIILKVCLFYANNESDRQDLFQDILLQTWKSFSTFRSESKFSTWLYRIALNTALMSHRRQNLPLEPLSTDAHRQSFQTVENDANERLLDSIKTLNEIERSVVLLYLDGYNYEEMEVITGISSGALRVKMSRIKQKIKKSLK